MVSLLQNGTPCQKFPFCFPLGSKFPNSDLQFIPSNNILQPLLLTSSLSLSLASYFSSATISPDTTSGLLPFIGSHRRITLGWSAFLVFLNLPYTGLFVLSGVKALAEAEKREQGMI